MKTLKEVIGVVFISVAITLIMTYTIASPMGRSEAHAVLIDSGTMVTSSNEISYHSANTVLTELELEALAKLSKNYVVRNITTVK